MKSLIGLWQEVARDCATWHGVCTDRDVKTVTDRVGSEGTSFLTITLPQFGSDLERGLDRGWVGSDLFLGFRWTGGLPAFLRGFLSRIFDARSGKILNDPCVDCVRSVRQLCYLFKKVDMECSDRRTRKALAGFVTCEDELKRLDSEWTPNDLREFSRMAALLFGDVFDAVNREIDRYELSPGHGPGATTDRLMGNQKWTLPVWTERLEAVFPYVEYGIPNHRYWANSVAHLTPSEEPPVKVVTVPKTQKTPRVIAIEQTCMQYMQQALKNALVPKLEGTSNPLHFLGFSDQLPNQEMARIGSLTGALATLDLSEASDRVSNRLVVEMLKPWPSLSEAVQATRSTTALLPGGCRIRLSKFASMGSALCFPIEAMVFCAIVFVGIQSTRGRQLNSRDLVRFRDKVRVYGDDIIVPAHNAPAVVAALEAYGLKVNTAKSFWTGLFRESCGADYFRGEWVTPLRLGKMPPRSRRDVSELQGWVEFSNALHLGGYWHAAKFCADLVSTVLGPLPVLNWNTEALALKSFVGVKPREAKWDRRLHRQLAKAWVVESPVPVNKIDGVPALHKALTGEWSDPLYRDHLARSGRPYAAHVKRRWVPC